MTTTDTGSPAAATTGAPPVERGAADLIDYLLSVSPGDALDALRARRPAARENAQRTYEALFRPVDDAHAGVLERLAVAAFVTGLHGGGSLHRHYAAALAAAEPELAAAVATEGRSAVGRGPYGVYREPGLAGESVPGPAHRSDVEVLGPRLGAALEHAQLLVLRPREASPGALDALLAAGWSTTGIVTLSQLVAFLTYQVRVVHGLALLGGDGDRARVAAVAGADEQRAASRTPPPAAAPQRAPSDLSATDTAARPTPETALRYPDLDRPHAFTRDPLGWVPWLEPLSVEEFTERHWAGVVDRRRADNAYFALLARDPETLEARTRADLDIFYNTGGGLPRAERELAATAASRTNGCVFCASVHARFAAHHSRRPHDVQRLLDEGVSADLGERWNAVVAAAVALTATPAELGPGHLDRLRTAGLGDLEIADLVHGAAFFNWANRLMLSLGEPIAG